MNGQLVEFAIRSLRLKVDDLPDDGTFNGQILVNHHLQIGKKKAAKTGLMLLTTTIELVDGDRGDLSPLQASIRSLAVYTTPAPATAEEVGDEHSMAPMMHNATSMTYARLLQVLQDADVRVALPYPTFKVTFSASPTNQPK